MAKDTKKTTTLAITPLADKVVLRPLTDEESGSVSASGIILPDSVSKEKPEQAMVVAVGPGKWDEDGEKRMAMEVKVGDRVVFKSWQEAITVDGDEYWIVPESDIHGIVA